MSRLTQCGDARLNCLEVDVILLHHCAVVYVITIVISLCYSRYVVPFRAETAGGWPLRSDDFC